MNWSIIEDSRDMNDKVEKFNANVLYLYDKFVPVRKRKVAYEPAPWIDKEIREMMDSRDIYYKKWKRTKTGENKENYQRMRNKVKQQLRNSKSRYFFNKLNEDKDIASLWNIVRSQGIGREKNLAEALHFSSDDLNNFFVRRWLKKQAERYWIITEN